MTSLFIVFEGPDGSGTTLHTRLLKKKLEEDGYPVVSTFEPTDGPIGTQIRSSLHSGETLSPSELQQKFVEDRNWHVSNIILPALDEGNVVITDRYLHSTICYGQALGLEKEWLKDLNKDFIQPDICFFLLPPYEVCLERMNGRDKNDSLEEDSIQKKVYEAYGKMAEEDPEIYVIDTCDKKEDVANKISTIVSEKLKVKS